MRSQQFLSQIFIQKHKECRIKNMCFFYRRKQAQQENRENYFLSSMFVLLFYDACKYKCIEISKKNTEIFISPAKKITKKGSRSLQRETIFERIQDNFFFSSLQRQIELIFSLPCNSFVFLSLE
jgi:hypothetical protein